MGIYGMQNCLQSKDDNKLCFKFNVCNKLKYKYLKHLNKNIIAPTIPHLFLFKKYISSNIS